MAEFDTPGDAVQSPTSFAHVVLRTGNLKNMEKFYTTFLGGRVAYGNAFLSFITYDEEHHRVALIELPETVPKVAASCGLEHIAFSYSTVKDLLLSYLQRKKNGIDPCWCVNHGPTTSIYYRDPDRNMVETQVDNFDNVEDADAFMKSPQFEENPIGTEFDPEELVARIKRGESDTDIKRRIEIGPRLVGMTA